MILRLVIAPDNLLRQKSEPVIINNEDDKAYLKTFISDMVETCRYIHGLGLSAIQVGIPTRIFVVVTEDHELCFVNPEIINTSEDSLVMKEGCLSFPGVFSNVERPSTVKIKYLNSDLEPSELEATGIVARCILHEYDHLEGKLFVDYLGNVSRDMAMRKSKKAKKNIAKLTATRMKELEKSI